MAADGQAIIAATGAPLVGLSDYARVRARTEALARPLSAEDQQVQSMADVSPTKWHLAHTTWFFETFLLIPHLDGYEPFDPAFGYLFNSYYEAVGERHPRPERGLLSRPSLDEVMAWRSHVDEAMARLLAGAAGAGLAELLELGLNHEEQHQELILADIKHVLSVNPLAPAYDEAGPAPRALGGGCEWLDFPGGLVEIGHAGAGFAFDNEGPRHKVWLEPYRLADRLVTNGEWAAFIDDGGYERAEFWLSDGWALSQAEGWRAPLYWRGEPGGWREFTLAGEHALQADAPVCHVSLYEADAFARWAGKRLPTEAEWEAASSDPRLKQMFDEVWQWTASPYVAYPRYRPARGALGEYNGKFMSGQMVLRGSAAITPPGHSRPTYRNFYPPSARWCMGGVRLADDA